MKNLKKLIPVALFALAIVGAFSTHAMGRASKTTTTFQGYVKANPLGTVCNISIQCSDQPGPLCMVGATQIWGKDVNGKCIVELRRVP